MAIISGRRSDRAIAELMELLVLRATSGAKFAAYCANRPRELVYKAQRPVFINEVPHGERVVCGHDPWLYGRKVSELRVELDDENHEVVTWREPNDFRFSKTDRFGVEVAREGQVVSVRRPMRPLSTDIWRPSRNAA